MLTSPPTELASDVRQAARAGFEGLTVGRAPGFTQANLMIVPEEVGDELVAFCTANPSACPLLGVGAPGAADIPELGAAIDVRTDLPRYEVHRNGKTEQVTSLDGIWRDDLVAIATGCWFGAEAALLAARVRLRHVELGIQGPLFRTNLPTTGVGRFHPRLVVSMRPFRISDVATVVDLTSRLPMSHGAPVHRGDASGIGIDDITRPDWGEVLCPEAGEVALFWPCGLTGIEALDKAGVEFFITHAPGSMLVTDRRDG